jgi:hypothetical protein
MSAVLHFRVNHIAEQWHWDHGVPPGFRSVLSAYQVAGLLAACFATATVLMVPAVRSRFRARIVSPALARRPLPPRYLLLLYCLGFLGFVLSYNVPLLGQVSERAEEIAVVLFLPFVGGAPILSPLAHGFSPSDSELIGWSGNPYLAWLFVLVLVGFAYCALRIGFWFVRRAKEFAKGGPARDQQGT